MPPRKSCCALSQGTERRTSKFADELREPKAQVEQRYSEPMLA
jgi:hypothetical protein